MIRLRSSHRGSVVLPGSIMRLPLVAVAALAFLRIVLGLHFFLEGLSHLRDPDWSSAGFRKAAVGPLADFYRSELPQTGDWSATLAAVDGRSPAEAAKAWQESVVSSWRSLLVTRGRLQPLGPESQAAAEKSLDAARTELADYVANIQDSLVEYRLQVQRLEDMQQRPGSRDIPFERERVAKKRRELAGQADGWMADAAAIGRKLVTEWDAQLPGDAERNRASAAIQPTKLWKADRFVSWSLATIGACLVLGIAVKFNAMGAACFLATVVASQPFWVAGAQPTYDHWVEMAALFAVAALPTGGWSGLDYFLRSWCPLTRCCAGKDATTCEVTR